jgi:hypothetical protein
VRTSAYALGIQNALFKLGALSPAMRAAAERLVRTEGALLRTKLREAPRVISKATQLTRKTPLAFASTQEVPLSTFDIARMPTLSYSF